MKKRKSQELSGATGNKKKIAQSSSQLVGNTQGNKFKRKLKKKKPAIKNHHNVQQKIQHRLESSESDTDDNDGIDEYEGKTGARELEKNVRRIDTTNRMEVDYNHSGSDEDDDDSKESGYNNNIPPISGKRKAPSKSSALDVRTGYESDSGSGDESGNDHEKSGQVDRQHKSSKPAVLVGNPTIGLDNKDQDMDTDGSVETDSDDDDDDEGHEFKDAENALGGGVKEESLPQKVGGASATVTESDIQNGDVSQDKDGGQEEGGTDAMSRDDAQKFTNAILTKTSFSSLKDCVCEETLRGISDMGFSYMTEIQDKSLPHLLEGRDLLAAAKTGSGKTLAFLIPAIELIHKLKFMPRNGTGVIIISPTRELCMQIYGVLKEVMVHHYHTYGIVMGGTNRATEMKKLAKGVNILVATPGRLLDHMQKTPQFLFKNLQCLVIDEADRILDIGFEEDMKQIVKLLPKKRQTMLFSATQTRKTEDLARISLKKQPIYIGVDDEKTVATVNGLEQGYVFCPSEKRFLLLFTFLKKNRSKKVMVFMSSCKSVKYHAELLNYIDLPVACIHGRKKQANRTTTFFQFCQAKQGTLICTDVAARGLDIPAVDWIVQFDPPDDPKEYIHRVGRTARGLHGKGHALLILRPEEAGFLRYLKHAKVPISEYDFSWAKVANIQIQLEKLVEKNYFLHVSAKEAYKGYIRSYQSHSLKKIFKLESLDLNLVAKSFGFRVPPSVDLIVPTRKKSAGRDKGHQYNPKQHNFKKAQKSKIFRHVESKRDRKDMRSVLTH